MHRNNLKVYTYFQILTLNVKDIHIELTLSKRLRISIQMNSAMGRCICEPLRLILLAATMVPSDAEIQVYFSQIASTQQSVNRLLSHTTGHYLPAYFCSPWGKGRNKFNGSYWQTKWIQSLFVFIKITAITKQYSFHRRFVGRVALPAHITLILHKLANTKFFLYTLNPLSNSSYFFC